MVDTQAQKIQDCFNGRITRNCGVCQAHYSQGGTCCFGQWTNDRGCHGCPYENECSSATSNRTRTTTYQQPSYQPTYQAPQPSYRQAVPIRTAPPSAPVSMDNREPCYPVPVRQQPEHWGERLAKDAAWGALEGMFRMIHQFFSARRWP